MYYNLLILYSYFYQNYLNIQLLGFFVKPFFILIVFIFFYISTKKM